MKLNSYLKKFMPFLIVVTLTVFIGYGCDNSGAVPGTNGTSGTGGASKPAPTSKGNFTKCTYTDGLADKGYQSAIVYYPCEKNAGPFPATTLTGGWTNTKETMDWIGSHVVTHGYILYAMTPNDNMGGNPQWRTAHNAGIARLKSENNRAGSPIAGLVKTDAMQIMGYSKGGGGTLLAANDQGANIKSAQAIAPYMDTVYNITGIKAATILYTGAEDPVAFPSRVVDMFNALPKTIDRTLAYFNGFGHMVWFPNGGEKEHNQALTYIVSWMKVYLNGDNSYASYLDGSQNWFYKFEHYDAGEGPMSKGTSMGGCGPSVTPNR
jgi:dienelactone hydrolase